MDSVTAFRSGYRKTHLFGKLTSRLLVAALALGASAAYATTPGTAPGQFSVSPTGAATYQISIPVPPGVNGLKPSLALLYNSQAGNGLLGQGWSLSGLSVISHCPKTIDQDGVATIPYGLSSDRLCLDGQRLIMTSNGTTYGAQGSTYRTEIDSFRRVIISQAANGNPSVFTVVDRGGLTSTYGGTGFTVAGANGGAAAAPLLWLVSTITDRYNNFISFSYNISNYNAQTLKTSWDDISQITYGNAQGTVVGKVVFAYSTAFRADAFSQYFALTQVTASPVKLTGITVQDGSGNVQDSFNLGYQDSNPQQLTTTPTELTSVQECGSDGTCYPATTFNYGVGANLGFASPSDPMQSGIFDTDGQIAGYVIADFDGDGIPDYVFSINGTVYVLFGNNNSVSYQLPNIATSSAANPGISLTGAIAVDLNGDGKQELMVPYYPAPGTSNNNPIWWALQWNGQTGANANLTAGPVPTTDGSSLPTACINVQLSCIPVAIGMDLHHNGQSSVVYAGPDGMFYYYANAGGYPAKLNPTANPTNVSFMNDVNGVPPKLTPINWQGASAIYVSGQSIAYSGVFGWNENASPSPKFTSFMSGDHANANQVVPFDANGDGYLDAVAINVNNWCYVPNTGTGFNTANISTFGPCATAPSGVDYNNIQVVDWYGNGRQEVMVPINGTWYLFVPTGNTAAFVTTGIALPAYDSGGPLRLLDVNGDGQPDLVYSYNGRTQFVYGTRSPYLITQITNGLGHNTQVGYVPLGAEVRGAYVNNNSASFTQPVVNPPQTRLYAGAMSVVKDFAVDTGTFANGNPQQVYTYYLYGGAAIEQWGRGFLGFSQVQAINFNTGLYTTDTYSQGFPFTGMVLTSTKNWNSQANLQSIYVHSGSTGGVKVTCAGGNPAEPSCEIQNAPKTPSASFLTGGINVSATTNQYLDAYEPSNPAKPDGRLYTGVYSPYQSSATTQLYDIGPGNNLDETTTTRSTYQVVGTSTPIGADVMPTDITVTTQDNTSGNGNDQNTVETQSDYSTWEATCPGHPGTVTVIHSSATVPTGLTQTETFTYDGHCFLTQDVKNIIDPAGSAGYPMTLTKIFVPDAYGNARTSKVSGTNVSGNSNGYRVTRMVYDSTERFPVSITNPLGQVETLTYDGWGNKLSDMDANGDTVTYTYDGFERKTEQSGPLPGVYVDFAYTACYADTPTCAYNVIQATSTDTAPTVHASTPTTWPIHSPSIPTPGFADSLTEYDELGRAIETQKTGFGSNEIVMQQTQYDLMGRVAAASAPYKSGVTPPCWDVKNYDVLNRVIAEYQPLNSNQCGNSASATIGSPERTINTSYSGLTTTRAVSDPSGNTPIGSETTVTTLNVLGKPSSVQDQGNPSGAYVTTSYGYDVWGNLTSVQQDAPNGPTVTMGYDSIGDKLTMHDPDMGAWSYTYDALGELLTQTDAKGQTVHNQYDWLGRMFDRVEPEGETRWVYDIGYGAGIGKLAYTVGPNGVWEGYAYDGYGETTDKITVVGGQEYWVTNTYTDQGQVFQVVYPNMTAVNVNGTPAAPTGLTVTSVLQANNQTVFNLAWALNSASQNGQIFHLYRTPSSVTSPSAPYEIYSGPVPNWQDSTVTVDDTYTWWLQACNDTNCSSYISQSLAVVLPPTVPVPVAPATTQTATSWALTWSAASLGTTGNPGPISYVVQRSYNSGTWTQVYSGAGTSSDGGLTYSSTAFAGSGDGTYSYRVQACANGACSNFGTTATETIAIQPTAPQSVSVPATVTPTTTPASIAVTWSAPAVNGGTANLSYTVSVYKGTGLQSTSAAQSTTGYTDTESLDGIYSYTVKVCDTVNTTLCASTSSSNAAVTLPPVSLGTPTYYTDTQAPTWSISWNPASLNSGSSGSISYTLQQSWNGGAFTNVTGTVTSGSPYWQVATAVLQSSYYQNGTYTYQLRACTSDPAVGSATACTAWIASSGSGYVTTIAPGVPTNISVPTQSNGDGSFTVTFSAPTANSGGVVTSYVVQPYDTTCTDPPNPVCTTHAHNTCTVTAPATSCTFAANTFLVSNDYQLQVAASDTGVKSPWVQETFPTIWYLQAPAAPTLTSPNYTGAVSMSWTNVSGATSYNLYQSTDGTNYSLLKNVTSGSGSTSTSVSGLAAGTYYYKAAACQTTSICGPQGAAATVSVVLPPAAPTGLSVSPSTSTNGSFGLSWTAPAAATQYRVYQSTNGGNYVWVDTFNNSSTGTINRAESGLSNGNYSYYVYAANAAGQGPASNTVSGTVLLPPASASINETDAGDDNHYTISWSAATATSYTLYFAHATQTGPWSAWAQVTGFVNTTATSDYTQSALGNYNLEYYVTACNASGCVQSAAISFVNPKEVTGCKTCAGIKPTPPTPSPVPPLSSTAGSAPLIPTSLDAMLVAPRTMDRLAAVSAQTLGVFAPWPRLPALGPLPIDAISIRSAQPIARLPTLKSFPKRHARARPVVQLASALPMSPRQAYFLAHAGRTTAPKPGHLRKARPAQRQIVATAQYAPAVDVILSLYPPLRQDPRVLAHYVARGGALPVQLRNASSTDCRDTDNDVNCTSSDSPNALMVGYFYNANGYLQKVEKLNANAQPIAELWQATEQTAFGSVDKQVFDAPLGSTSGAFSVNDNYDTGTGILTGTSVSAADTTGGSSSLSASYTWDGYDNLLTRGLSETVPMGQTGAATLNESFTYDAVNRMKQVTDSSNNATYMSYDNVGGFTGNGAYSNYQYSNAGYTVNGYTYSQPHAVSSLTAGSATRSFTYDANGNLTSESGDVSRTLAWTSYNKPTSITSGTTTETFTYGPSRERLHTTVTGASDTVSTTYIDDLFEQVNDSSSGNTTYRHYVLAGAARVGVETIVVNSGGSATSDTLSFFVHDQVGSVIAEVTEALGGSGQQLAVYSHDPWGKARPTSGTGANIALGPNSRMPNTSVMSGQHEGFAGHEDLEDLGIVDMEGRIYDPEVGRFLSADPTVQYPDSSQGYNRYTYVNNNPLSLSDPTGYTSEANRREISDIIVIVTAYLCAGTCSPGEAFLGGAAAGYESSGGTWSGTAQGGTAAMAFALAGDGTYSSTFERSVTVGLIGGAFTMAGGGRFGDGFMAAFVTSEFDSYINSGAGSVDYNRPVYVMERAVISAIVGGTVSQLTGGDFADGALVGAMQEIFSASSEEGAHGDITAQDGSSNNEAKPENSQDRPDLKAIAADPWVAANINYAWDASNPYAPTNAGRKEYAFWILRDNQTGKYLIVNISEATATNDSINPGPTPTIKGTTVVAYFHTHPNPYQVGNRFYHPDASKPDRDFSAARNMPLIIRSRPGLYFYGPSVPN